MKILDEDNLICNNIDNGLSRIFCKCGCCFSATECDIEEQIIAVKHETGIKGFFGCTKSYIRNRYITCPNCFRKMKIKYYVEDFKNE